MCPACVASATMVVGSVVSGGGVAAIVAKVWKKNRSQSGKVSKFQGENPAIRRPSTPKP